MIENWIPTEKLHPRRGQKVEWIDPDGDVMRGIWNGCWYFADSADDTTRPAPYRPRFWRPLRPQPAGVAC